LVMAVTKGYGRFDTRPEKQNVPPFRGGT
jgi:hypothetical protein